MKRIISDSLAELNKVNKQMKLMETVLLGAAKQAQLLIALDEIAKFMNENEQLRSLHEEQRVYALVGERDALRREQNKKNDGPAFHKGKDEIITQVMVEGAWPCLNLYRLARQVHQFKN
ncbi:hypothetical protein L1987_23696 [Smallanthus sonchifolius]|uniref:Uncharacterized protein n=1 Tax=Smallanthus sonchifolius TaxID=185202 RepID=A0ACB9IL02_9ASTR|nr:hypothetical protein L1987_23696 [Smallanthus sonchifolius]